jgi:dynein heavy chain
VQDRRKFGPIGWNVPYAFTNEDLMVCRKQTILFVERFDAVPYKVLNYLGAIVNYGGRVTDDKDSILISTILRKFMCPEALEVGHSFSASGHYKVIEAGDKEDYLKYIDQLPLNPEPEAFGLHENAEITTQQNQTINLLLDVLSMQPKSGGGGGVTREEIIGTMAKDLERQTPPVFDTEYVQKHFPTMYHESMNTVLLQECVRYNRLLADMAVSISLVQRALIGEVVMSEELE